MEKVRLMRKLAASEPARADYWRGYERGLRRTYHGEAFGTEAEHALFLAAVNSPDEMRASLGRGYRDGLRAGTPPNWGDTLIDPTR